MLSAFVCLCVASAAALGLAGCGGDETPAPSPSPGPPAWAGLGDRLTVGIWEQEAMPLTKQAAVDKSWIRVGDETCHPSFGHRYRMSDKRITPTLLYNNLGEITGLQGVVPSSTFPKYPSSNLKDGTVQDFGDNTRGQTFYFKDPAQVCSASATVKKDAAASGSSLGDRLWMRVCEKDCESVGADITYLKIPLDSNDTMPDDFTAGGCAPTGFLGQYNPTNFPKNPGMGTHWWENMEGPLGTGVAMEDAGPVFLLYSAGKMRAMGLVYSAKGSIPTVDEVKPVKNAAGSWYMNNTELWEFATQPLYPHFFAEEKMPIFLQNLNTWNDTLPYGSVNTGTLHIFFTDHQTITCP